MIKVEMAHDYCLHVPNAVTTLLDSFVELLVVFVVDSSEYIVEWEAPLLGIVFASASPDNNQSKFEK
jgi:hypothetical protein